MRRTEANATRQANLPQSINQEARTVEVTWTTGSRILRTDLQGEPYYEELSLDPTHLRLGRLNAGAALLNAHRSERVEDQIGVVERAWIENGEGKAVLRFHRAKKWKNSGGMLRAESSAPFPLATKCTATKSGKSQG